MIPAEQRRRQLSELLQELGHLSEVPDCTVLLPLVEHKWSVIRHDAIGALEKCRPDPRIETALLSLLAATDDDYDRICVNAALGSCGTATAISALAAQIHHRTDDVKCSAVFALARIGDESTLPIFLDALTDRSLVARQYALRAISQHGNEQAIPAIRDRVHAILARRKRSAQSELLGCLQFLARYPNDDQARATLSWVTDKRLDYLTAHEVGWIQDGPAVIHRARSGHAAALRLPDLG
jgi:HEAT repeat protein